MKPAIVLAALLISVCESSTAQSTTAAASCALTRPDFGAVATEADRKLFAYNANAPLNLKKTVESTTDGTEISAISYDSPDGGSVPGLLFNPVDRPGPRPGLVLMMGMAGARNMAAQARALAARGAVVVVIDAPFTRRGGQLLQFTPQDRAEQIQLIKDLQRAVDVLRAQPNVDHQRIGFWGMSYGGAMGALLAGIERRITTAVLTVADGGLVSHNTGPERVNGPLAKQSCEVRAAWLRAMKPIEPIRFIAHAPPTSLLLLNGRSDNAVPAADAEALHAAAPEPKTIRWYDAGHGLNQQAYFDVLDWLHERLGLDARQ